MCGGEAGCEHPSRAVWVLLFQACVLARLWGLLRLADGEEENGPRQNVGAISRINRNVGIIGREFPNHLSMAAWASPARSFGSACLPHCALKSRYRERQRDRERERARSLLEMETEHLDEATA